MKRTIPIMIILGLLLLCLPMAAADGGVIDLIPVTGTDDGVTWAGDDTVGWTLTLGNEAKGTSELVKNYKLAPTPVDFKLNKVNINADYVTIDGGKTTDETTSVKITNGTGFDGYRAIDITGNYVTLKNWDVDYSATTTGSADTAKSAIAVYIKGNNVSIQDSVIKAGISAKSSSQAIVVEGNNVSISNNVLTVNNAETDPSSTGSVGVRFVGASNGGIILENTITALSESTSRNVGVSYDNVTSNSETIIRGNKFNLKSPTGGISSFIYISPGANNLKINISDGSGVNEITGENTPSHFIYIDKNANGSIDIKNITLSNKISGADGLELAVPVNFDKIFLEYKDLNVVLEDIYIKGNDEATVPGTIKCAGNAQFDNLTFTNKTAMIKPLNGADLTVKNSVFGGVSSDGELDEENDNIYKHGILCDANQLIGASIENNEFNGNFRKGLLLRGYVDSDITVEDNEFNGISEDWNTAKSSVITVVGNESSVTTFSNNTVSNYYKVLSIDNTPPGLTNVSKWIMEDNTFDKVAYVLDINGTNEQQNKKGGDDANKIITMTNNFVKNPDKELYGIAPKVLNSDRDPATPVEFENPDFIYPYYYYVNGEDKKSVTEKLSVSISPESVKAEEGKSVTFTANANGGEGGYTYRWQSQVGDATDFTDIPGATEATYTISSVAETDAGKYKVVVTAGADSEEATATLEVVSTEDVMTAITNLDNLVNGDMPLTLEKITDAMSALVDLGVDILKEQMSDPAVLENIRKLEAASDVPPSKTGDLSKSVEIIGAVLSSNGKPVSITAETVEEGDDNYGIAGDVPVGAWVFRVHMEHELKAPIFIRMLVPEGIDARNLVIIHYSDDGTREIERFENLEVDEEGYVSFMVTELSKFVATPTPSGGGGGSGTGSAKVVDGNTTYVPPVIDGGDGDGSGTGSASEPAEDVKKPTTPTTPKDEGSSSTLKWILVIGAVIVIIAVAFFLYQRNKKN